MRSKRTNAVGRKAKRRTVVKKSTVRRASLALPASRRRHRIYNVLALMAALLVLAALAGLSAWPRLTNQAEVAAARISDANFAREIARAVAEGRPSDDGKPLFTMPAQPAVQPHEPRRKNRSARGLEAMASVAGGNELIAEARKYLGGNPTGWSSEWCGRFLDMVLKKTGHKGGGNLARGYIKYGTRVAGPEVGAIAIFSRKGGGHVGIVTGTDSNGNPIVISGNHNRRVAISVYPARTALAYVRPAQ